MSQYCCTNSFDAIAHVDTNERSTACCAAVPAALGTALLPLLLLRPVLSAVHVADHQTPSTMALKTLTSALMRWLVLLMHAPRARIPVNAQNSDCCQSARLRSYGPDAENARRTLAHIFRHV
jgi:hypothetical protein